MTVAELIDALRELPQDLPVKTAYDSFVCVYAVEKSNIVIVDPAGNDWNRAVYLCAMDEGAVHWHVYETKDDDGFHVPGRMLALPEPQR